MVCRWPCLPRLFWQNLFSKSSGIRMTLYFHSHHFKIKWSLHLYIAFLSPKFAQQHHPITNLHILQKELLRLTQNKHASHILYTNNKFTYHHNTFSQRGSLYASTPSYISFITKYSYLCFSIGSKWVSYIVVMKKFLPTCLLTCITLEERTAIVTPISEFLTYLMDYFQFF